MKSKEGSEVRASKRIAQSIARKRAQNMIIGESEGENEGKEEGAAVVSVFVCVCVCVRRRDLASARLADARDETRESVVDEAERDSGRRKVRNERRRVMVGGEREEEAKAGDVCLSMCVCRCVRLDEERGSREREEKGRQCEES